MCFEEKMVPTHPEKSGILRQTPENLQRKTWKFVTDVVWEPKKFVPLLLSNCRVQNLIGRAKKKCGKKHFELMPWNIEG